MRCGRFLLAKRWRLRRGDLRKAIAGALATLMPIALAQNTGMAVVFGSGGIYLNGAQLSNSNAIVPGDVVQTKEDGTGMITATGLSVTLEPNTIVRFQGSGLALDRGAVAVASGQQSIVNARDLKVVPVSKQWTQFYVTRSSGVIGITARKNDVTVSCGGNSVIVKEGHQLSRDDADNCGLTTKGNGAPVAASGPIVNSTRAAEGALVVGAGLTVWALWPCDDPISPDKPQSTNPGSGNGRCH